MPLLFIEPIPSQAGKSELLELLTKTGGIARQHVGTIELRGATAAVEVPERWQLRLVQSLQGANLRGRRLRVWTDGAPAGGASRPAGVDEFFNRLLRLMEVEAQAEAEQAALARERLTPAQAESAGNALVDLAVDDISAGLGGRLLVTLLKRNRTLELPWTRIGTGSPVLLSLHGGNAGNGRGTARRRRTAHHPAGHRGGRSIARRF